MATMAAPTNSAPNAIRTGFSGSWAATSANRDGVSTMLSTS